MRIFLSVLGWLLSKTPEFMLRGLCLFLGTLLTRVPSRRRRVMFSNMKHVFADMPQEEIEEMSLESSARMIEMGIFVLASPYIPLEKLRKRILLSDYLLENISGVLAEDRPIVLMVPHFTMMESITLFPALYGGKIPTVGVFYRPFDNKGIEDWVRSTREKFGVELLSRKDGLHSAFKFLRNKGVVALLFDQNAGGNGALSLFCDRVCSTSDLGGTLVERFNAACCIFYARRTGFWRAEISGVVLPEKSIEDVTIAANDWLENAIRTDAELRTDWLWSHNRWRTQDKPHARLRLGQRRNMLEYVMRKKGMAALPRNTLFVVSLPDDAAKAEGLLPLISAMRASRPDGFFCALCAASCSEKLRDAGIADEVLEKTDAKKISELKLRYPDTHIILTNNPEDCAQAYEIHATQRFGIAFEGCARLTHSYKLEKGDEALSSAALYEKFLRSLGMEGEVKPADARLV